MGFSMEFFDQSTYQRSLNAMKNSRHINLVGGLYRLLSKVMINRLKKWWEKWF